MSYKAEPLHDLRSKLNTSHPAISYIINDLANELIKSNGAPESKTFNDPIWKTISLNADEVRILDQPLVQRLRHIRQLGLAYLVYPSAHHTRFEHSIGALHISNRALSKLQESESGRLSDKQLVISRRRLRLAALLHDSGHTVFSHIGERALGSIPWIDDAYRGAHKILSDFFLDSKSHEKEKSVHPLPYRAPPVAELISVLFVLSPAMEVLLSETEYKKEDLLAAAALIYGRSYKPTKDDSREIFAYVGNIISGDLDADKLDYVARDAYFAGIPVAADIDRLLSQIIPVKERRQIPGEQPYDIWRLGIQPAGVATVEMFILTRAYLFNRVYQHPVVRAAERQLFRSIMTELQPHTEVPNPKIEQLQKVFGHFYMPGGDDACLASMNATAAKSLRHDLPKRVLGLTQRSVVGYDRIDGELSSPVTALWSAASSTLSDPTKLQAIERMIASESGGGEVYVDWTATPPIKEDPEIYVRDRYLSEDKPLRLNQYFDMAQMARAYDHVRNMVWVFASDNNINKTSAIASATFAHQFGLIPSEQSFKDARIDPTKVRPILDELNARQDLLGACAGLVNKNLGGVLAVPPALIEDAIKSLGSEAKAISYEFSEKILLANLSSAHMSSLQAALVILRLSLSYVELSSDRGGRHKLSIDEGDLQKEVREFLDLRKKDENIEVSEHDASSTGIYDITVKVGRNHLKTVIELKAEDGAFETVVKRNEGQIFQYLQDTKAAPFGILLCRFRSGETQRQPNFVKLHTNSAQYPSVIFAVGQHVPLGSASKA